MYASELPQGIETEEGILTFRDLYKQFARTEHGRRLEAHIRFGPMKPAELSHADWERALGPDVNNLRHLLESLKLTQKAIAAYAQHGRELSLSDMELLQLAAVIHDWQEAYPHIGDAMVQAKNGDTHAIEMQALREMADEIVEDAAIRSRIDAAIDEVLMDPSSRLGEIFHAVERLGYMRTGLKAWKRGSAIKGAFQQHFQYLSILVFRHNIPFFVEHVAAHPPIALFLAKHEPMIDEIAALPVSELRYFPPEGIDRKATHRGDLEETFDLAKEAWARREIPRLAGEMED